MTVNGHVERTYQQDVRVHIERNRVDKPLYCIMILFILWYNQGQRHNGLFGLQAEEAEVFKGPLNEFLPVSDD